MLLGFGVIYVITPKDLAWHLDTSLWRLLLQLWPSALFVYCLIVNAPGPRRSRWRLVLRESSGGRERSAGPIRRAAA
jgi:hypothetical protein